MSTFHSVFKLVKITNNPTTINIGFSGNFPTNLAAIGAAMSPPIIRPATSISGMLLSRIKKVIELTSTTKNSARHTDPMTYRGLLLFESKVLVTNVPQPPPANASINPPADANHPARLTFTENRDFSNALRKI